MICSDLMREVRKQLGEFAVVSAAAAVLLGLGAVVTYASASAIAGCATTLAVGVPLALRGRWGCFGLAVAGVLALLGGMPLAEVGRVAGGEHATGSLQEIAQHPSAARFTVTDPVRVDAARAIKLPHRHDNGRASPRRDHTIAPIAAASARTGGSVHVYAACHNVTIDRSCSDAWSGATDELVRVPAEHEPCYRMLVPEGVDAGTAVFVHWDAPGRYTDALWHDWTAMLRVTALVWLAVGGLALFGLAVTRRAPT